jgi:nucleotide-binding universal stress UspA family protein
MPELLCPIPKMLVPVDDTEESRRAAEYAGCLASPYGNAQRGITLIHVIGAGYFTSHAGYTDLRVLRVEESGAFDRIRQLHYGVDIFPILERAAEILTSLGVTDDRIGRIIVHGKVWKEVLEQANEGGFSTIVMGRTVYEGESAGELGSVALSIIQRAVLVDIYLVGRRVLEDRACPIPRMLIAMDGSSNSLAALEHALCMAQAVKGVSRMTVVCVRGAEEIHPDEVFEAAQKLMKESGLSHGNVRFLVREGDPGKEIAAEAELGDYTTLVMGRRGHTGLRHLTLGAVPLSVIHRTVSPTIALISA